MKTIKDYEKEFDKEFNLTEGGWASIGEIEYASHFKDYFFQKILPQVLSEIIPNEIEKPYDYLDMGENTCIKMLKQKAKEMGINLPE